MAKAYISPSTQDWNQYSGGGTGVNDSEEFWMRIVAWKVTELLAASGIMVKLGGTVSWQANAAESNAWGADIHVEVHTNAGGGHGTEVWHRTGSTKGQRLAQCVYPFIAAASNQPDRGVKASTAYGALNSTNAPAIIIEAAFHDNVAEAEEIRQSVDEYALAIARGIAKYHGVTLLVDVTPPPVVTPPVTPPVQPPAEPPKVWKVSEQGDVRIVLVKA